MTRPGAPSGGLRFGIARGARPKPRGMAGNSPPARAPAAGSPEARTTWRRNQSVANSSLGANPRSAGKMQEVARIRASRSRQMVEFRLHPGSSAVISRSLITGNLCATSRDLLAGQNLAPGDSEPIPQAMREPPPSRNSGRHRSVTAGVQLPHRISARALSCLSNPTASGRWTRHSATSLKLSTPAAVTTQRRRQRPPCPCHRPAGPPHGCGCASISGRDSARIGCSGCTASLR